MKQRNKQKRLSRRIAEWALGGTSRESKVRQRWESNGYHKPGSNNK